MFKMLGNLTKAVVSVAVAPVAIVADAVMLIPDACDGEDAFTRTGALLKNAGKCVTEAVKPEK